MKRLAASMMRGRLAGMALVALTLVAVAGLARDGGHAKAATKYTTLVGNGRAAIAVEMFLPENTFINAGDTIEFMNPYEEIHTVTFLGKEEKAPDLIIPTGPPAGGPPPLAFNPKVAAPTSARTYDGSAYANSGIIGKGQSWSLTFPKEGTFPFLCILHPGMVGNVNVLPEGTHVPTQRQRDFEATQILNAQIAKAEASVAGIRPAANTVVNAPSVGQADIMRFLPARISVGLGQTITWNNNTPVPHTVSFIAADGVVPFEDAKGNLDPRLLFPVKPSQNYEGTGYYNSGFIGTGPESTAGTSFNLTFTKAGTYPYICILHADQGMTGVIEVGGASAAGSGAGPAGGAVVRPPSTGDAGLADETSMAPWLMAAGGVLAFGFSFLAIVNRKLRA